MQPVDRLLAASAALAMGNIKDAVDHLTQYRELRYWCNREPMVAGVPGDKVADQLAAQFGPALGVYRMNGRPIHRNHEGSTYIPLPRPLWRSTGHKCECSHCNGAEGFYDTLAIPPPNGRGFTWTVHWPELQRLG